MLDRSAADRCTVRPRVLLVEDEDIIAMQTEEMLEALGYESSAASPRWRKG